MLNILLETLPVALIEGHKKANTVRLFTSKISHIHCLRFLWDVCNNQQKLQTMVMKNVFWGKQRALWSM